MLINKTTIVLTNNTEAPPGKDPVNHFVEERRGNKELGTNYIKDFCDSYDMRATFFVDYAQFF